MIRNASLTTVGNLRNQDCCESKAGAIACAARKRAFDGANQWYSRQGVTPLALSRNTIGPVPATNATLYNTLPSRAEVNRWASLTPGMVPGARRYHCCTNE
jgi:hypothetical protein